MEVLVQVLWVIALTTFVFYGWDLLVSLGGFLPFPRLDEAESKARFAILIPAHNEGGVTGPLIESLLAQRYPREQFEIYVIADNCVDDTAERARQAGVRVLERTSETGRGKGYAVQWAISQIRGDGPFDALSIFDADNLADPDFLATMNAHLAAGEVAIQGYLDTRNPEDSWVTRSIAIAYFISNRFWFRARTRLRLPATLGGTGFALAWSVVDDYPWDPGCLTDDLELSQNLLQGGLRVTYTPYARTYDEKPPRLVASMRQRGRWMQGHNDVASRFFFRHLWAGLRRPSLGCLDAALYLLQPLRIFLNLGVMVSLFMLYLLAPEIPGLADALAYTLSGWAVLGVIFVVYPTVVAIAERVPLKTLLYLPIFLLFGFTWLPPIAKGLVRFRVRIWDHTVHGEAALETPPSRPIAARVRGIVSGTAVGVDDAMENASPSEPEESRRAV